MAKFLIGVLTGGILAIIVGVVIFFSFAKMRDRTPDVAANSVLYLRLNGEIPERVAVDYPIPFFKSNDTLTVSDIWGLLRKAAVDSRIKAITASPRFAELASITNPNVPAAEARTQRSLSFNTAMSLAIDFEARGPSSANPTPAYSRTRGLGSSSASISSPMLQM